METKLFEIRDAGTFIPVIAICPQAGGWSTEEHYLIRRCGYHRPTVLLSYLDGHRPLNNDPYDWTGCNTMRQAHLYIEQHWFTLVSGEVIDIEFIRGDTPTKKVSERLA